MPKAGRRLEDVVQLGGPDPYGGANPLTQSATVLRELQVFPQPLQKPHPQVWEPLTTERSIRWAAQARRQRLLHRRTDLATAAQYRHLL